MGKEIILTKGHEFPLDAFFVSVDVTGFEATET